MRLLFLFRVAGIACGVAIAAQDASACSCGGFARNAWETAQRKAQSATTIFEGVPEHLEWQWSILNTKAGDLIPADAYGIGQWSAHWPQMVVTFRVQRVYKGELGAKVDVTTGIATMDCAGRRFSVGESYLLYGLNGAVQSRGTDRRWRAVERLRYLRKERPVPSDVQGHRILPSDYEKARRQYVATSAKICGTIIGSGANIAGRKSVAFLSVGGYSPYDLPDVDVDPGGSFCSYDLRPGKYYL